MMPKLMILLTTALSLFGLISISPDTSVALDNVVQNTPFFLPYEGSNQVSDIVVDGAGGVHVSYKSKYSVGGITPIYYAYCATNCDVFANWTTVTVGDARLGVAAALAVTPAGQPRLVWYYQQTTLGDGDYIYAACDVNCLDAANWSQVTVATTKSSSRRNLTLTPQGQPRFVYTDISSFPPHKGLFYAYCDVNCTVLANWSETQINAATEFYDIDLIADSAGKLHLLYNFDNSTAEYVQCAADCDNPANWIGEQLYAIGLEADLSLAITDNNQPRFAIYTGSLDHQTYYAWCDTDCATSTTSWQNWGVGLADYEGEELDLALDGQNRPHLVYHSQNLSLGYAACTADCDSTQSVWQNEYVETAAELNVLEPPPPGCSLSTWDVGERPSIALDNMGISFMSYDATQMLGGCTDIQRVRLTAVEVTVSFSVYLPTIVR
ncbi:MAG: hypothetical protein GY796_02580 [Chloroflexi bacterium]|nr:hypothetical protein [Chloroflexota bacterium]